MKRTFFSLPRIQIALQAAVFFAMAICAGWASSVFAAAERLAEPKGIPSAAVSPAPDESRQLVDGLSLDELEEALRLVQSFYVDSSDVNDAGIARATLDGLLDKIGHGVCLVKAPSHETQIPAKDGAARLIAGDRTEADAKSDISGKFLSELFPDQMLYIRLGAISAENIFAFHETLRSFGASQSQALAGLILDLRASAATGVEDYKLAADLLNSFVPKDRVLFTMKKMHTTGKGKTQEYLSIGQNVMTFPILIVVVDGDTAGAAEVIAAVLRRECHAMIVGSNTAGLAVNFADFGLSSKGSILLRLAVAEAVLPPDNARIFPAGLKPDLVVAGPRDEKLEVFRRTDNAELVGKDKENRVLTPVAHFVFDRERPRFNEAALITGTNPDLDAALEAQARRREGRPAPKPPLRDRVLQRAVDWETSIRADAQPNGEKVGD